MYTSLGMKVCSNVLAQQYFARNVSNKNSSLGQYISSCNIQHTDGALHWETGDPSHNKIQIVWTYI